MGVSALISSFASGYQSKKVSEAEDARQQEYLDFLRDPSVAVNQMKALQELFTGPQMAKDILEGMGTGDILNYLLNPLPMSVGEKAGKRLFDTSEPLFREVQQLLTGPIRDPLLELLRTGFRTDLQPIIAGEQYRLANETAPALAEKYGGALFGSGFQNALAQAGEDLGMYLGEQQVAADEAAAARRMGGLNMAPGLFTAPLDLQLGYGKSRFDFGNAYRTAREMRRPGYRQLAAFPALVSAEGSQGFLLPSMGGQGGGGLSGLAGAGNLGAFAGAATSALSSLGKSLYNWYQNQGTDGGTTTAGNISGYGGYGDLFGGSGYLTGNQYAGSGYNPSGWNSTLFSDTGSGWSSGY